MLTRCRGHAVAGACTGTNNARALAAGQSEHSLWSGQSGSIQMSTIMCRRASGWAEGRTQQAQEARFPERATPQ